VTMYRSVIALERASLRGVFMLCWQAWEMRIRGEVSEALLLVVSG